MNPKQEANLERTLGRIEGKLDGIDERLDAGKEQMADTEKRVRSLEGTRSRLRGGVSTLSALTGYLGFDKFFGGN